MHPLLASNVFLVKEQVGMFKASNNFDIYVLAIDDQVAADDPVRQLILSAVLCIDMVLKE